jgi:hypothetical protein
MIEVLSGLGIGLLAGMSYGLASFSKTSGESFDFKKFGITAGVGLLSGVLNFVLGWDVGVGYDFLLNLGLVPIIENCSKAVWRSWLQYFFI